MSYRGGGVGGRGDRGWGKIFFKKFIYLFLKLFF